MKENKNTLDELNKGCAMGMDAIDNIIDKVEGESLKKVLKDEYDKYKKMHQRIEEKYPEFSDDEPTETSAMNKVMTTWMTDMKLMTDHSDGKIAELLTQGVNMGIIEGRRLLNHKEHLDKEVEDILSEYVEMQERSVEIYKQYL
ncbi:MAG: DUF2383 domain-containing protein [Bacilli bacterium]|nr:DUF2383 domain-containing protein [Bacilli bacterium]